MSNNTDYGSETQQELMFLKYGGAITFRGLNLYMNDSYGKLNNGFRGGFLLVDSIKSIAQTIIVENSIFVTNFAGNGAVAGFAKTATKLSAYFNNNYFKDNVASG
jgi:hypothetical protein